MKRLLITAVFTTLMVGGGVLVARADPATPDKAKGDQAAAGLTVAILDFTADDPANPNAGSDMASALTAMLSGESGLKLVERQSLLQTLHEHELNLTGLVNQEQAIKVGKLVGENHDHRPRFPPRQGHLHHGQAHRHRDQPGRGRDGQRRFDGRHGDARHAALRESGPKVRQVGPKLVAAADNAVDPLPALKKKLSGRRLPVVAVIVREQHHGARSHGRVCQGDRSGRRDRDREVAGRVRIHRPGRPGERVDRFRRRLDRQRRAEWDSWLIPPLLRSWTAMRNHETGISTKELEEIYHTEEFVGNVGEFCAPLSTVDEEVLDGYSCSAGIPWPTSRLSLRYSLACSFPCLAAACASKASVRSGGTPGSSGSFVPSTCATCTALPLPRTPALVLAALALHTWRAIPRPVVAGL